MTTAVVWVDSRCRSSGASDSNFEVALRETIRMSNACLRIDKVTFTDSFLTTDAGSHLYFSDGAGGIVSHPIPDGAYMGVGLAAAIQTTTGRTTTYSALTNSITLELADASQPWLSDKNLEAHTGGGFPFGASRENPKSLNAVLGDTGPTTPRRWSGMGFACRLAPTCFCALPGSGAWTTRSKRNTRHPVQYPPHQGSGPSGGDPYCRWALLRFAG